MDNIIAIAVGEQNVRPHELAVVTEVRPDFLPQATFVQSDGRRALLYSREGLTPLSRYGEGPGGLALTRLFDLLTGYIRCLLSARDMLLDSRLISSDPDTGIFVTRETGIVKAVWGMDVVLDDGAKICRVARALAGRDRVQGAKASMERMIEIIRSENPSLINCLKAAESICREVNHIANAS